MRWNRRKRLKLYDYFPTIGKQKNLPLILQILGTKDEIICSHIYKQYIKSKLRMEIWKILEICVQTSSFSKIISTRATYVSENKRFNSTIFQKLLKMKDKERILPFCVSFEARTNSIHLLKNRWYRGWRKDGNVVDIFQRLRGIIYVLLSELCAKDSTTVEGITPSTLKISTESSVNSGARNQESGCKHRERERHQLHIRGV